MAPLSHNFTVLEHDDLIGMQNGRDALGDDNECGVTHLLRQSRTQGRVGLEIERRKAVVKDIEVRGLDNRTSDG